MFQKGRNSVSVEGDEFHETLKTNESGRDK